VLGHVGLHVDDLDAAQRYWDALAPLLGFEPAHDRPGQHGFRPTGGRPGTWLFLYEAPVAGVYRPDAAGLQHLAFSLRTHDAVDAVHVRVVELGGTVLHAPRDFPEYPPHHYATFWLDPHGVKLEAVCHRPPD
jgi:catechol 2,3-dioxygenase-like lactoylglutathione lyase family enzyme